ncbi:multiple epidermal growth factor-like domains protein 6 [Plakobranchus ocellatus]|uniref:Multiple epidermal growth factor-like domains protein 6 n=1 Tax=Plakobranchus ocellatus TaxID=259542 RepID=A0AAV4AMJ1_9GAST|nr:multiple epidermal growth factor-like domains protein 6 [Plakobranchus ocellatus]
MKHWAALLAVIALSSAVFINTCTAACWNYSWFGKSTCDYRCHCDDNNNCDRETGQCADRCALGWFGPACQYRSILFFSDAGGPDLNWLTDGDPRSCNSGNTQTVTVELDKEHPLTWIRVVGNNSALIHRLELSYRTKSGASEDQACSDSQTAKVDDFTLDISCPTSEPVSHLTLSGPGVGVLCSLDISKGRNVAIAQETRQSSTFSTWYDRNAVDGNVGKVNGNEEDLSSTCTHTDSRYDDGWWSVTFETFVQVNSFVIYNRRNPSRRGCCEYRLIGFNLKAYNTSSVTRSSEVFDYTDPGPEYQDIYTITPQDRIDGPVKKVRIVKNDKSNILTLCEVIVFGDSACDPGKFGRECERECNCADDEEACFVSTGGCPSGCAPGYTGEDCWTSCTHGKYGFGCLQTCSQHCVDPGNCDSVSGACVGGCQIGYEGPLCKESKTWIIVRVKRNI